MATECGDPPTIQGADILAINTTAVEYKCNWGTKIQGYDVVLCEYGAWSTEFPVCMINWRTQELTGEFNYTSSFKRPEIPNWLITMWAIFTMVVFLSFLACFVLLCIRLCWCCRGKAVSFGGTYRYSQTWVTRNLCYCCKFEYKPVPSRKKMMQMMMEKARKETDNEPDDISLSMEEKQFRVDQVEIEIYQEEARKAAEAEARQNEIAQLQAANGENSENGTPEDDNPSGGLLG
ncbi:uncharacterized protein [Argopecten irradians]|uniref:uncharacterized protein n=1 Tax=Argopecten irradians TaxID=31199 RepID=UPI003715626D